MKNSLKNQYFVLKKHKRWSQKISLNQFDIQVIKNELKSWFLGIEEDDQLPLEISCIVFCFEFDNHAINLSVSGFEHKPQVVDKGPYAPLEAQYFYCELLNAFVNNKRNFNSHGKLFAKTKKQIFDLFVTILKSFFCDPNFSYLKNKTIFIGEFLKPKYKSFIFN